MFILDKISLFVFSCFIITPICAQSPSGISIEEAATKAVQDYFDEKYDDAIRAFETALVHYKMLKHIDIVCGGRCSSPNISKALDMDFEGFDDLYAYGNLLAQANCVKICKEEHPFTKSKIKRPGDDYIRDLESRSPYNYLQFSYFQTGQVKKACQAAYTFLQANPDDTQMQDNIEYYKGLAEVSEDFFTDLEGKPYSQNFKSGVQFYESEQYAEAVNDFEEVLIDYFTAYEDCKNLCYIAKEPETFHGFLQAVVSRYIPAMECTLECEKKLRPVVGTSFVDDFVSRTYKYLQFAYYQVDKWEMAVPAAASAFLLDPNDETTMNNMQYYAENAEEHGLDQKIHFQPRPEAVKYHLERKISDEILNLMRKSVDYEDEREVEEDDSRDSLLQEISKQIVMELGQRLRGDIG